MKQTKQIVEIRFHGRGGQGVKTAADLLAHTALETDKYIQAFPEYGPERAGAPIKSFVRISKEVINLHCGVTNPDIVVVVDPTLIGSINITEGVGEDGILIVNTSATPETIRKKLNFTSGKVYTIDATKIALKHTGSPVPNIPMLGALIKVTDIVSLDKLSEHIKIKFGKKLSQEKLLGNLRAIQEAYDTVSLG